MNGSASGAAMEIELSLFLWRALARHLPAHVVRGVEADLRTSAGVHAREGDPNARQWVTRVANVLVSARPELFGH